VIGGYSNKIPDGFKVGNGVKQEYNLTPNHFRPLKMKDKLVYVKHSS
jgi:hypothetical protein